MKVDKILSTFSEILIQDKKIARVHEHNTGKQMTSVIRAAMQSHRTLTSHVPGTTSYLRCLLFPQILASFWVLGLFHLKDSV